MILTTVEKRSMEKAKFNWTSGFQHFLHQSLRLVLTTNPKNKSVLQFYWIYFCQGQVLNIYVLALEKKKKKIAWKNGQKGGNKG